MWRGAARNPSAPLDRQLVLSGALPNAYQAARLASKQPPDPNCTQCSQAQPRYYLFARTPAHDLIAGPERTKHDLYVGPTGESRPHNGIVVAVPPGTAVVSEQPVDSNGVTVPAEEQDPGRGAPATSLNVRIGGSRRLGEVSVPLEDIKAVKRELGGTVNDVVLAASVGGLRRLLQSRGEQLDPRGLRAMVPISLRQAGETLALGNRVSSLFVELPAAEADAGRRYRQTVEAAESLKRSRQAAGAETLVNLAGIAPPVLHAAVARLSFSPRLFNVTITNVPGPQMTLYALGAPMRHIFPLVPIFAYHALGIAIASYDGEMVFGLNADRGTVPDLDVLEGGIADSLSELRDLAGIT